METIDDSFKAPLVKRHFLGAVSIALVLHGFFVALVTIQFSSTSKVTVKGDKITPSIPSYLCPAPVKLSLPKKMLGHTPLNALPLTTSSLTPIASAVATATAAASTVNTNSDALSQLLHQAIQAKQYYPDSALALGRCGIVTVAFNLNRDGSISDLHCVKSSGTISLDQAALEAVRAAAPFQGVGAYLTAAKNFELALRFELPS